MLDGALGEGEMQNKDKLTDGMELEKNDRILEELKESDQPDEGGEGKNED